MTPVFFGSAQRRLFGAYEAPRAGSAGTRAVLLCHPWGQEYIRAHRSMRRLASLMAASGRHVMRFDYFGTGDSMGNARDVTLSGWEKDIETAIEELRDTSGAMRVALVGLRAGATLAARVASRNKKTVEALAMWDPVVSGSEYVEELLQCRRDPDEESDGSLVRGFPLKGALADEMRTLDLLELVPLFPARTRVVFSAPLRSHERLRSELESRDRSDVVVEHVEELLAWVEYRDYGAGAIPAKLLETIAQWVR